MAALRAGFAERAGRPRPDAWPDLQARRHAGGLGGAGRFGPRTEVTPLQAARLAARSISTVCDACQRMIQRIIHGIGMMKAQASAVTTMRQRYSSPVPLNTTWRRVPSM